LPPALRRAAIAPTRRPAIPLTQRRAMIAMALHRPTLALNTVLTHGVFAIKLVAGVLAAGTVALAIMNNRDVKPATTGATTGYELASIGGVPGLGGNETVVFRRPSSRLQEPIAAADERSAGLVLSARSNHSLPQHAARGWPRQRQNPRQFDQGARLRDLRAEGRRGAGCSGASCAAIASPAARAMDDRRHLWGLSAPAIKRFTGDFT
jgi:hypothetical protein